MSIFIFMKENGVIWLNKPADSLDKVTTVKRVARVFRDITARLRNKRNRILVHRSMCLNCHWLKSIIIIIKFIPQVVKIPGVKNYKS